MVQRIVCQREAFAVAVLLTDLLRAKARTRSLSDCCGAPFVPLLLSRPTEPGGGYRCQQCPLVDYRNYGYRRYGYGGYGYRPYGYGYRPYGYYGYGYPYWRPGISLWFGF